MLPIAQSSREVHVNFQDILSSLQSTVNIGTTIAKWKRSSSHYVYTPECIAATQRQLDIYPDIYLCGKILVDIVHRSHAEIVNYCKTPCTRHWRNFINEIKGPCKGEPLVKDEHVSLIYFSLLLYAS